MNIGDSKEQVAEYWGDEGFNMPVGLQDRGGSVSRTFGVNVYPTNFVLGPDGKVIWRGVGWDEEAVRKALGLGASSFRKTLDN